MHFLLAALKIIDDAYHQDATAIQFPQKAANEIAKIAASCRAALGFSDEEITAARRALSNALRDQNTSKRVQVRMLHRSEESRTLFQNARSRATDSGATYLTLSYLLEELLTNLPLDAASLFKDRQLAVGDPSTITTEAAIWPDSDNGKPKSQWPKTVLDEIGRDLTALARKGLLAPVVGRRAEMTALARYLQRTSKRNVIITGEAGVGKTAIVEGLAQKALAENAPEFLRTLRFVQINVADLVAGTKYRGDMEQRVQALLAEAADPDLIIFFDEIHLLMKAGSGSEVPLDIANILKPALTSNDFRCIGATTNDEFERHIKTDTAFMRRFQVLRIGEPPAEEALYICREWARRIEKVQQVQIDDEAIEASILLSQLIHDRSLPDKAIDLLENAAAFVKISSLSVSSATPTKAVPRVGRKQIEEVLQEQYGISASAAESLNSGRIEASLRANLVGQDKAITELVESLVGLGTRTEAGLARPLGVFMFTGPTGVGKTFAAECLAHAAFGDNPQAVGRFNMSEYKERHELARLTGAPPGFVGHEHQGALFRFIDATPQGLILLDEMEKAHPEIQDYFLQIFDKGEARDSRGRVASFRRHLFVMTCNIVSGGFRDDIGFRGAEEKPPAEVAAVDEVQLLKHFRREFVARIDRVIAFRALNALDYQVLFQRYVAGLRDKSSELYDASLEIDDEAQDRLCHVLSEQEDGARGFARLFERMLAAPLLNYLSSCPERSVVNISWDGQRAAFSAAKLTTDREN